MSAIDHISFQVEARPIFDNSGNELPSSVGRAITRTDNDKALSIVGQHYVPIQYDQIVHPILHDLERAGVRVEERDALPGRSALYDLKGRNGAFVTTQIGDDGGTMRTSITMGNFIEVTHPRGAYGLNPGKSTMLAQVDLISSHNMKLAAKSIFSYRKIECMNGMTTTAAAAALTGRHTQGFNLKAMQRQIGNSMEMLSTDQERFTKWVNTRITYDGAKAMLEATIAKLADAPDGTPRAKDKMVEAILDRFVRYEGGSNVWALYNAVTWYQTHTDLRVTSNPVTTMLGREQKTAQMLNSNPWKSFINA